MKRKKAIITSLASCVAISLLIAGCSNEESGNTAQPSDTPAPATESPSPSPNQGITVNQIVFEEINIDSLDEEHVQLVNDYSLARGYTYWVDEEGYYTVLISLGQRPTAGYGIKVLSVEDNEGKTNISVEETKPSEGEMTAQVITYPYVLIRMTGITDNFHIYDTNNEEFYILYGENLGRRLVVCKYEGLIDNTSIETNLDGEPRFFRNDKMASMVDGLNEGIMVKIVYSTNDEGQLILESIEAAGEESEVITASGIYQGLIDGNSIEVLVGDVYMALRNEEVESMTEGLDRDDEVEITYSISPQGQFLLESIGPKE